MACRSLNQPSDLMPNRADVKHGACGVLNMLSPPEGVRCRGAGA